MPSIKSVAVNLLERHPYGYVAGLFLLDNVDALLPHEVDFYGFAALARAYDFQPKLILDVGANRGHSARAFLKLLPGWKVVSFEGNGMHEARLATIQKRFPDRFSFRIGAITDAQKGQVDFFTPVYRGIAMHSASAVSVQEALRGVELSFPALKEKFDIVKTTTSTSSLDTAAPDLSFAKFDIQGEEFNALKGMDRLLKRCKPVLLLEMCMEPARDAVIDFLSSRGFEPWLFDAKRMTFNRGWNDFSTSRNQFFIHEDISRQLPASLI